MTTRIEKVRATIALALMALEPALAGEACRKACTYKVADASRRIAPGAVSAFESEVRSACGLVPGGGSRLLPNLAAFASTPMDSILRMNRREPEKVTEPTKRPYSILSSPFDTPTSRGALPERAFFAPRADAGGCPLAPATDVTLQAWNRCLSSRLDAFLASPDAGGVLLTEAVRATAKKIKRELKVGAVSDEDLVSIRTSLPLLLISVEALRRRGQSTVSAEEIQTLDKKLFALANRVVAIGDAGIEVAAHLVFLSDCEEPLRFFDSILPSSFPRTPRAPQPKDDHELRI